MPHSYYFFFRLSKTSDGKVDSEDTIGNCGAHQGAYRGRGRSGKWGGVKAAGFSMCQDCSLKCWRLALEPENRAGSARQRGGVGVGPQMTTRSYIDPGQAAEGDQGAVPKGTSGGEWREKHQSTGMYIPTKIQGPPFAAADWWPINVFNLV